MTPKSIFFHASVENNTSLAISLFQGNALFNHYIRLTPMCVYLISV